MKISWTQRISNAEVLRWAGSEKKVARIVIHRKVTRTWYCANQNTAYSYWYYQAKLTRKVALEGSIVPGHETSITGATSRMQSQFIAENATAHGLDSRLIANAPLSA